MGGVDGILAQSRAVKKAKSYLDREEDLSLSSAW